MLHKRGQKSLISNSSTKIAVGEGIPAATAGGERASSSRHGDEMEGRREKGMGGTQERKRERRGGGRNGDRKGREAGQEKGLRAEEGAAAMARQDDREGSGREQTKPGAPELWRCTQQFP